MKWLKFLYPFAVVIFACFIVACSPSSALTGLIGSKPEVTAQVGAENVKQTVGVTAKQDASSKQETTFKESAVGKVDTSNKNRLALQALRLIISQPIGLRSAIVILNPANGAGFLSLASPDLD
ncbi:holin [Salmonella virus STSR3]|nr:holin [Salmonella virus STSR3]